MNKDDIRRTSELQSAIEVDANSAQEEKNNEANEHFDEPYIQARATGEDKEEIEN